MRQLIVKGYSKYSRSEKPFILPNLATGAEVILPLSQLRWLLDQPDYILSQAEVNTEFLRADWTMLHPSIATGSVHGPIIRREMTKGLDTYADAVVNEIQYSLGLVWGDSTQWHEIVVYDTMLDVISRISNRALVGFPLCRNESYLRSSRTFARFVIITAGLINLLPSMLRPILGPLIIARDIYHYHKIARLIFPIIKNRMADFQLGNDYKKPDYSVHNDYIHWALHHAFSQDDPIERTPEMITKRLVVLTFGTIQSSVITITNALVDIASSPSSVEVQEGLREEVEGATTPPNSESWKTSNLVKMVRIDSVLRESMRLWGFISRGVMKMVMVREGIKIPSGEHLPFGAKVGVSAYAIHHDEAMYPNAFMFDAFRFSRPLGAVMLGTTGNDAAEMLPMVKSTNNFMGFSHGRNTCPGRFFAANQLKLLLANISSMYDIEPIPIRPQNPWLNNSIGPPISAKFRVRRRQNTTDPLPNRVVQECSQ
ncbi:hypothetical protein MMC31_001601 [Peltigera leucophlebia]|nr:hypothetical protein [Peltigera leucophlebia]